MQISSKSLTSIYFTYVWYRLCKIWPNIKTKLKTILYTSDNKTSEEHHTMQHHAITSRTTESCHIIWGHITWDQITGYDLTACLIQALIHLNATVTSGCCCIPVLFHTLPCWSPVSLMPPVHAPACRPVHRTLDSPRQAKPTGACTGRLYPTSLQSTSFLKWKGLASISQC